MENLYKNIDIVNKTLNASWRINSKKSCNIKVSYNDNLDITNIQIIQKGPTGHIELRDRRGNNPKKPFNKIWIADEFIYNYNKITSVECKRATGLGKKEFIILINNWFSTEEVNKAEISYKDFIKKENEIVKEKKRVKELLEKNFSFKKLDSARDFIRNGKIKPSEFKEINEAWIEKFFPEKGYGFIGSYYGKFIINGEIVEVDFNTNAFFHVSNCISYINSRAEVVFKVKKTTKGYEAYDVQFADDYYLSFHLKNVENSIIEYNKFLDNYPTVKSKDEAIVFNRYLECINYDITSSQTLRSLPIRGDYFSTVSLDKLGINTLNLNDKVNKLIKEMQNIIEK